MRMFHSVPGVPRVKMERLFAYTNLRFASTRLEKGLGEVTVCLCQPHVKLNLFSPEPA
jgi:hypothetical protein